jgi:hypothetical protein
VAEAVTARRGLYPADTGGGPPAGPGGDPLCERSVHWDGSKPSCGKPATALTRAMCVHEHYGEGYVCDGCLAMMRLLGDDSGWCCEECQRGPESHECPMPMQVIPLEASRG